MLGLCQDYAVSSLPYNTEQNQNASFGAAYAKVASFANHMSDTLVINIQDYHSDYGTQLTINKLLEKIYDSDKKVEIYLEGAYQEIDLSYLDGVKKLPQFDAFADMLLKSDQITGAEFFALKRPGIKLNGLENPDLYLKNLKNMSYLISNRDKALSDFNVYYGKINKEIAEKMNAENRKLYNIKQKRDKEKISHEKYISALLEHAAKNNIELKKTYPNVYKSGMMYALHREINFKKVNSEMPEFLNFVKSILTYKDYIKIENSENKFFILSMIYRDYSFKTEELTKFFRYSGFKDTLNKTLLLKEEEELLWNLMELQCADSFQKQGVESFRVMSYSQRLLHGEILTYEYEYLTKNNEIFLNASQKYLGVPLSADIKKYYDISKEFYDINEKRNSAFIEKAGIIKNDDTQFGQADLSEALEKASLIKVLVTGGYHSEGLREIFEQNGISYIILTPEITSSDIMTKNLYEQSINIQAKAAFSAFQKFLNKKSMIIINNDFNIQNFCEIMLDYDTVRFFAQQESLENEVSKEFAAGIVRMANDELGAEKQIKSLDVNIVSKEINSYGVIVNAELIDGSSSNTLFNSKKQISDSANRNPMRSAVVRSLAEKIKIVRPQSQNNFTYEIYKYKLIRCIKNFDRQAAFCKANEDKADFEIIAPEILKNAAELMEAIKALDKIYANLDYVRQGEAEQLIVEASQKYYNDLLSSFDFGEKNVSFDKTALRLVKTIKEFGLEAHEDMEERLRDVYEKRQSKSAKKTSRELENGTMKFFSGETDKSIPVLAYAASEAKNILGGEYDEDAADMIFVQMKYGFFRKQSVKRAGTVENIVNALNEQSREILNYFTDKKFDIENQEETEDILIRSIAALEILEQYPQYARLADIIKTSEELFKKTSGSIDIKTSENAYLAALKNNDTEHISRLKKEMDEKIEYARRITIFQNSLIKTAAKLGQKDAESSAAARDFLIRVADGSVLEGRPVTEGMYWLRQQSILRLKDFNHPETVRALNGIIEAENRGETSSADSVFMSVNLEASNVKTLSLKLHSAGILIDFKRQEARELLKQDIDAYLDNLVKSPAKDRFAYIAAVADVISDRTISNVMISRVLKGLASTGDNGIIFSSNILLDFIEQEFNRTKVASMSRADIIDFLEAFTATLSALGGENLAHINFNIKTLRDAYEDAGPILSEILSDLRFELGNMGSGEIKKADWISDYSVFMISGGGVTEEIVRLKNMNFSGNIAGLMSSNDDGGSTLLCRGYNADKNGIYSLSQGDVVNFMTSAASLDGSDAPLKDIIKSLMNKRFDEDIALKEALAKMKDGYKEQAGTKLEKDFVIFWAKLEKYASICDAAGFSIINNSLKNLIFEAIAIDNRAYGEGFINPDGVYSAMKDFADLLGTKSVAIADLPYGNITKVFTKGGVEYIGQSYFSHTPHMLVGGRNRTFWTPENIGEVFDSLNIESRVAKGLKKAKVIIAGLCSWITSLGVQIANKDISGAIASNEKADKILITNPVKDDENFMSWSESTVAFLQRITKQSLPKMFNTVFAWQAASRDIKVPFTHLTETEIFDGKAGGYRGENAISVSGDKLIAKLKMKLQIIRGSIDIVPVARRDDPVKTNYKIMANPQILAEKILSALSRSNSDMFYGDQTLAISENIKNSIFSHSTVLFFGDQNSGASNRADALLQFGVNSFVFVPVSEAELEKIKLGSGIAGLQSFSDISAPETISGDGTLYFSVKNKDGAQSTRCYYAVANEEEERASVQALAKWFFYEMPTLAAGRLIKYEQVSAIESSDSEINFGDLGFKDSPLKILISGESSHFYDFTLNAKKASNIEGYINSLLDEIRKPLREIAYRLNKYKSIESFGDKKSESWLAELKELMISIDAWDDAAKRAAVLYALKSGFDIQTSKSSIRFIAPDGTNMEFYIDATGKFQAPESFMRKMHYLESLKVFSDMDDNIAPRGEPFSDEMKDVFASLTLYGMCAPVIITGNTDETLWVRFEHLPETVLEEMYFYTEVGGLRYIWQKTVENRGKDNKFIIDEDYTENISKAGIPADIRDKMRVVTNNVDYKFDNLFILFVKKTDHLDNYKDTVSESLSSYQENDEMLKLIKKISGQGTKNLLMLYWEDKTVSDVQKILDGLAASYADPDIARDNGLEEPLSEEQYIEALKIVSLLEYSRITFSLRTEDKNNKAIILGKKARTEILKGGYSKLSADSAVRVSLVPIRVSHIKNMVADLYAEKFSHIPELREYKVESAGRTTINIMKRSVQKTIPIEYEIETMNVPEGNMVYSGDEVFLPGMEEPNTGLDDAIAWYVMTKGNNDMLVVNTNLKQHDTVQRPHLVWIADILRRNGISVNSPSDGGVFLHEKILERLEYNFHNIMHDKEFEPENIIQVVKETVSSGFSDFSHYDLVKPLKNDDTRLIEIDRRMRYFRDNINWNKINENPKRLADLKQFLRDINVWDDPAVRAGFMYALKNKFMTRIADDGFFFVDFEGEPLDFFIDPQGRFMASKNYMDNMRELATLRVFSDIDDNIAVLGQEFDEEMTEIFSNLILYGLCSPSVISGSTHDRIAKRFHPLSEAVKEMITFYSDMGSQRYVWRTSENDAEYNEGGALNFFRDNEYSEKVAADIPLGTAKYFKEIIPNLDSMFDSDYTAFIKKTHNLSTYEEASVAAMNGYSADNPAISAVIEAAKAGDKNELLRKWKDYDFDKVKDLLDRLKEGNMFSESQYLEILKAVALLEYSRIIFAGKDSDLRDMEHISKKDEIERIINESYKKSVITSRTRIRFTPIRLANIRAKVIDMLNEKLAEDGYSGEYEAILGGPVTASIQKKIVKKSLPILMELERGLPGEKAMFTGDEVYFKRSTPSTAGIDDPVALLAMSKLGKNMFVVNTNLEEHDTEARPELLYGKRAFDLSGEPAATSVDVGKRMHKMILNGLEYNIGKIVKGKSKFKAENIIQVVKKTVTAGYIEYPIIKDFISAIEQQKDVHISMEDIAGLLSAA